MVCLLSELRRHGVRHQRRGVLLRSLCLGERERGVSRASLCSTLIGRKLRGLEVVLASEGSCLVAKGGLSVTVEAGSAEAIAAVIAPIASILWICAKTFIWSIVIASTIIPVSKTSKITPSRVSIPAVISIVATSASPWTTWKGKQT